MALYELQKDSNYQINSLLTTLIEKQERISMHGVKKELLMDQANSLQMKLDLLYMPKWPSNEIYQGIMHKKMEAYRKEGIHQIAFADIFLEDIKAYRDEQMKKAGVKAVFPVWGRNTKSFALKFIEAGFKAIVTTVDSQKLPSSFAGREYNKSFLADLPKNIDPCGEKGEFHTFVIDGPGFKYPIQFEKSNIQLKDKSFYFCDLHLAKSQ